MSAWVCVKNPRRRCSPERLVTVFTSQQVAKEGLLSLLPNKQTHVWVQAQSTQSLYDIVYALVHSHQANAFSKLKMKSLQQVWCVYTNSWKHTRSKEALCSLWDSLHLFFKACVVLKQIARSNRSFSWDLPLLALLGYILVKCLYSSGGGKSSRGWKEYLDSKSSVERDERKRKGIQRWSTERSDSWWAVSLYIWYFKSFTIAFKSLGSVDKLTFMQQGY